jgi:hypothetical protein
VRAGAFMLTGPRGGEEEENNNKAIFYEAVAYFASLALKIRKLRSSDESLTTNLYLQIDKASHRRRLSQPTSKCDNLKPHRIRSL